jgi:hypothetical protein
LTLSMAISIYGADVSNIESPNKINIYEAFVNKSIKDTLKIKLDLDETKAASLSIYEKNTKNYLKLIEMLAICTIFYRGEIPPKFQQDIKSNGAFINRFDLAKMDNEYKSVNFLHKLFAEYLIANLLIHCLQGETQKTCLSNNELKNIFLDKEYFETRKHICAILASDPTVQLNFVPLVIKEKTQKLLKILIEEDCYELYLQLRKILSFRLNKSWFEKIFHDGEHPLYLALKKRTRKKFIRELVKDGARFEEILSEKFVLHLAVEKDLYEEVQLHFESLKSDNNQRDINYEFPLNYAAENGSRELVEFLIEKGADVNAGMYFTALHDAIKANSAEVVELLITNGADLRRGLKWAADYNRKELFDFIYKIGKVAQK